MSSDTLQAGELGATPPLSPEAKAFAGFRWVGWMHLIAVSLLVVLIAAAVLSAFLLHPLLSPRLQRLFPIFNRRLGVALGAQSVEAVARQLLGPLAFAVREDASTRQNGITNLEVSFYRAALPHWLPAGLRTQLLERGRLRFGSLHFVKKVFSGPFEAALLRALYRYQAVQPVGASLPVPRVLGVQPDSIKCMAYLEDLPATGEYSLFGDDEAVDLSQSIADLQAYLCWAESYCELSLPGQSLSLSLRRAHELAVRAEQGDFDEEAFLGRLREVQARLEGLPLLLSHNDIGPGNMSVSKKPEGGVAIRFIDFGTAHRNFLGADLHHYAIWSFSNASNQRFFDVLAKSYAEAVCQPLSDVRLGAYGYALRRILMRWWRREDLRGSRQRARIYLHKVCAFLERIESEIVAAGG